MRMAPQTRSPLLALLWLVVLLMGGVAAVSASEPTKNVLQVLRNGGNLAECGGGADADGDVSANAAAAATNVDVGDINDASGRAPNAVFSDRCAPPVRVLLPPACGVSEAGDDVALRPLLAVAKLDGSGSGSGSGSESEGAATAEVDAVLALLGLRGVGDFSLAAPLPASLPLPGSRAARLRWGEAGRGLAVQHASRARVLGTGDRSWEVPSAKPDEGASSSASTDGASQGEEGLPAGETVPVLVFDGLGQRLDTCGDLRESRERWEAAGIQSSQTHEVYLVPASEHYMWPVRQVGHKVPLRDVPVPAGREPGSLELVTLSSKPRLFRINQFLSPEECDMIIELAKPQLFDSKLFVHDKDKELDKNIRSSSQTWLKHGDDAAVAAVDERVAALVHVPLSLDIDEQMQVLRYDPAQHYHSHYDYFAPWDFPDNPQFSMGQNRFATVFFYLTDVEEGGETVFPYSTAAEDRYHMGNIQYDKCDRGLKVAPRRGDAVFWYHMFPGQHMHALNYSAFDNFSLHGGCDVTRGQKWAANKWIRNKTPSPITFDADGLAEDAGSGGLLETITRTARKLEVSVERWWYST